MPKGHPGVTKVDKTCPVCGKVFGVKLGNEHQKTCSVECGQKLRIAAVTGAERKGHVTLTCKHCQKEFETYASRQKQGAVYCSKECSDVHRYTRVEKTCESCGNLYRVAAFRADGSRFCGNKCASAVLPKARISRVSMNCQCCGKEMQVKTGSVSLTRFCSPACARQIMRGEGSPHWKGVGTYEYIVDADGNETKRKSKAVATAKTAKRNADQARATPAWADIAKIRAIYRAAERITKATGTSHHVDHIVPLHGKTVSGLHNHFNLQVIPWRENLIKHNKHWPDKP